MGPIGVLLAVLFAPLAAALIQMTISRTREYSADRLGAEISGNPLALASALRKISAYAGRIEMPSAERNPASAPLFIVNPLTGARMDNLFSTHPNVENRIRALEAMAGDVPPQVARRGRARSRPSAPPAGVSAPGLAARRGGGGAGRRRARRAAEPRRADAGRDARSRRWRPRERARAQALAAGTLRHLGRIDALLGPVPRGSRRRRRR